MHTMPDEETVDLEQPINKAEERIKSLNSKVIATSTERDEALAKAATLEKENAFLASFSDMAVKYPTASEFRDQIKEKVMSGYTAEDATVSVLNSQGKLIPQPPAPPAPAAGGSASNILPGTGTKSVKEMSQAERREAIIEAEKRGDIGLT